MTSDGKRGLPVLRFDTRDFDTRHRAEAWRAHIAPFFDVDGMADLQVAEQAIAHLDTTLIGYTRAEQQAFSRGGARLRRDAADHFLVQIFLAGGGTMPDASVAPGDMLVIDMGREHMMLNHAFAHVTAVIPRSIDPGLSRVLERLHGRVLSGADTTVQLLGRHLTNVWELIGEMTSDQARHVSSSLCGMTKAMLGHAEPLTRDVAPSATQAVRLSILQHIEANLDQPVEVNELTHRYRVSRSTLYRMFEPEGGLQAHVRSRRLRMAFRKLRDPLEAHHTIAAIAWSCGFASEAHFSRAFRQEFGATPRAVRLEVAIEHFDAVDDSAVATWLSGLPR